ncbi:LacI family DNA-binding transcriptional regulator [Luedemannella flava]|uniref:LacI family DNA-binding transcriptional regulator n=1 Tax=Luedemannella flava TaxID=349316 RepID=A0ABN2LG45_9ACTN
MSNYLNRPNSVAAATRERIRGAIDELGFVRNAGAALMRSGRARTIGLVVLDVANPFFTELARGAEEVAREHELLVILCNSDEDREKEERYLEVLEEQRVLGVLISAVDNGTSKIDWLRQRNTSVVLVESARANYCSVRADDIAGGELAAQHLISLGHRSLVFATASLTVRQYQERLAGVHRAMARHGLPPEALTVIEQGVKGNTSDGRLIGDRLLATGTLPGTGIVCGNDLVALGLTAVLLRAGVRIPHDVSVVGYDDIELAEQSALALTTIAQPKQNMGRTATQLLIEEAQNSKRHAHQQIVFQPELVVRESTGPAPAASPPTRARRTATASST